MCQLLVMCGRMIGKSEGMSSMRGAHDCRRNNRVRWACASEQKSLFLKKPKRLPEFFQGSCVTPEVSLCSVSSGSSGLISDAIIRRRPMRSYRRTLAACPRTCNGNWSRFSGF